LVPVDLIAEFFITLGKALRAFQLYDENNPVYQRFTQALAAAFQGLWEELDELHLVVEEDRLLVEGEEVYRNATRSESLAFLLYKDGIRSLTFRRGIEREAKPLLTVLNKARLARSDGDDLITLLWEADLRYLQYRHVDLLAEGVTLPEAGPGHSVGELQAVLEAETAEGEEDGGPSASAAAAPPQALNREDFNPTLYSLDAREMEEVEAAIAEEMGRDVRGEVLNALFDRLEERNPDRQSEILEIVSLLVPGLLARGELLAASGVLAELRRVEGQEGIMTADHRQMVSRLLDRLSSEETVAELVRALEGGTIVPSPGLLADFLVQLRAQALGILIRAAETTPSRELQEVLREAVAGIAQRNRKGLVRFLQSDDPIVLSGALFLAGRMKVKEAAPYLTDLLYHVAPEVRKAAVQSVLDLQATTLASALQETLLDPEAEVRVAAARALEALRYRGAGPRFREILQSKEIRSADLTEQIAMFEAYGAVEDPQAVSFLGKYLNGKGFLGRREPSEIRACAALALGKVGTPEAKEALRKAVTDDDPVVRNAVGRALRGGQGGAR
jgi:hypothetical protein